MRCSAACGVDRNCNSAYCSRGRCRPDAENVTEAVDPLTRVASIDDEELVEPWTTLKLLGDGADKLKSKAAAATVNEREVE